MENIFEVSQEEKDRIRELHETYKTTQGGLITEQEVIKGCMDAQYDEYNADATEDTDPTSCKTLKAETTSDNSNFIKQKESLLKLQWKEDKPTVDGEYEVTTLTNPETKAKVKFYRERCPEGKVRDKNTGGCIAALKTQEDDKKKKKKVVTGKSQDPKLIKQLNSELASLYKAELLNQSFNLYGGKDAAAENRPTSDKWYKKGFELAIKVLTDPNPKANEQLPRGLKNKKGNYYGMKLYTDKGVATSKFAKSYIKLDEIERNEEGTKADEQIEKEKKYYPSGKFTTTMAKMKKLYDRLAAQKKLPPPE